MLDTWPHVINSIALSHDTVYLSIPDVLDVQKVQLNLMLLHICMKYSKIPYYAHSGPMQLAK